MSQKYRTAFVDPQGGVVFDQLGNRIMAFGAGVPTASAAGYLPGCTYQNTTSPTVLGTILYVNTGTLASATWTNIL